MGGPSGTGLRMLGACVIAASPFWFMAPLADAPQPVFGLFVWMGGGAIALGLGMRWRARRPVR